MIEVYGGQSPWNLRCDRVRMIVIRSILGLLVIWGITAPRSLLPCCASRPVETEPAGLGMKLTEQSGCGCCPAERPLPNDNEKNQQDHSSHGPPSPLSSCAGCGLPCCMKLLAPDTAGLTAFLAPRKEGSVIGAEPVPVSRSLQSIFRPPRSVC